VDLPEPDAREQPDSAGTVVQSAADIDALFESRDSARKLLQFCLWYLGADATDCDAEVVLYEFDSKQRLKVIESYRPGAQSLVSYYKLCLQRFCQRRAKQLRKIRGSSYDAALDDGQQFRDETDGQPIDNMLQSEAERRASEKEEARMRNAANRLSSKARQLVQMYYEQDLSMQEIAGRVKSTEGSIKVQMFRIRQQLKKLVEHES
jgi:RNA polymerase sigma factor (sigma-70 family)